jgi:hypothetical protein
MNNDLPAIVRSEFIADVAAERKALEAEAEYLNETATDAFESRGWPMSVTLDCDCHVTRTQLTGERKWDLCPTHEGLNP